MVTPSVSIIIPVYRELARLPLCLDAIRRQTYGEDFEILIVDNEGRSPSVYAELVGRYPNARLLRENTPGSYAARNLGIAQSRAPLLVFTDGDCLPEPHWLERGVARLRQLGEFALVGGRIALFFQDERSPSAVELFDSLFFGFPQQTFIEKDRFAATANLFTWRAVFERVGYFDPRQRGGDQEWGARAARSGARLAYAEEAVVRHPARTATRELVIKALRTVAGGTQLFPPRDWRESCRRALYELRKVAPMWRRVRAETERPPIKLLCLVALLQALRAGERLRLALGATPVRS